jgi:transposase
MNSELASFAVGLSRDIEAVRAAITQPWSTSPVEGQINRLKTIKRQTDGDVYPDSPFDKNYKAGQN